MESSSHSEYEGRKKIIKITKFIMLSINTIVSFTKMYIEYVEPDPFNSRNNYFNDSGTLRIVLILAMNFRILENSFMMFYAFHSIIFFLRMKIRNLSLQRI